jgi:hypothetical protein
MIIKRGKNIIKKDKTTRDLYNYYKTQVDNPVSYEMYKKFLFAENGLINQIVHKILYSAYVVTFPLIGNLFIKKYKPKIRFKPNGDLDIRKSHIRIDWANTKKLWESDPTAKERGLKIYHLNKHTKGYLYKFIWDKRKNYLVNKIVYKFKPVRKIDRELSSILKNNNTNVDYIEITY